MRVTHTRRAGDYRDVSPDLQRIRGPYPIAAGVAACRQHIVRSHPSARPGSIVVG